MSSDDEVIEHNKLIDGFGDLSSYSYYESFDTYCGICDRPLHLTGQQQKLILEVKRVPVKMLLRGAAFCPECVERRSRIKYLAGRERWRQVANGKEELERLREAESLLLSKSKSRYRDVSWPYTRHAR